MPLAWQNGPDTSTAGIDSRVSHPLRRVTDVQPMLRQLGQPQITSEMIDEISWRISELLRIKGAGSPGNQTMAELIADTATAPTPPVEPRLPHNIAIAIRIRRPLFR